jgi:hypothetical protein
MRKKLFIAFALVITSVVVVLAWPTAGYDISRVHPSLSELATPYQSVSTGYFADGGSISITIVDRAGRRLEMALPVSSDHGRSYPQHFIGATHISESGAVEIAFTDDTRRMLISIIEDHRSARDCSNLALISLRGALRDHARIFSDAAVSFFRRLTR